MTKQLMLLVLLSLFACKEGDKRSTLPSLDLMSHGMPIKIKAPADAKIESSDLGVMKDITVKDEGQFFLQITSGVVTSTEIAKLLEQKKMEIKNSAFFDEILEEKENGFIFRKKIDEIVNHDFRCIKIQGDQEYIFQTGLMGRFSLEDVQTMYSAIN